ncbi:hypothetical protein AJ80_07115 [Polytolypa hystricis UAMH7299]|uniref:Nuclear matrix protein n=1 Tax=Polytolypa hystricis (strain UAMH7299) TaxID=1447883 RepID=A0A2B7XQG5_POLH7|nr:hypothetical protein AJ80_07115 [Polytolypa hystricis UAMH7299]
MAADDIRAVKTYRSLVQDLLAKATELKTDGGIEPPLSEADLGDALQLIEQRRELVMKEQSQQAHYAVVETAFREKFYDLLVSTSIDDPAFIQIWNLLDIVSIFSDNDQCEPGLIFWLIEELLDSQTIDGCRKVFDYLESRRERNTAKHFKQKSLIILRSCNELLRRLSRAEDTVFCGRVFIFLFQSFPLGDKSSVNLRGEYHTENITTFDELPKPQESNDTAMDVDASSAPAGEESAADAAQTSEQTTTTEGVTTTRSETPQPSKATPQASSVKEKKDGGAIDMDVLYPIFWGLQTNFSAPTRLFDPDHFASFKAGLDATLSAFKKMNTDLDVRLTSKGLEESRRGPKRRRMGDGAEMTNFNPKYLTSRDLFELEVNDVAFRRHILVQALILLDFMISLSPKAKAKLSDSTNKSVLYSYVLSDEDATWVAETKASIASYLQQGSEGKFYYRMVDTVLTRDKNWVRWKAEGCPPIERTPVSVQDHLDTQASATKVAANKRLRATPLGSLDLGFLRDDKNLDGMSRLKEPDRFMTPVIDSYKRGIADDEFNIEMAQTQEEKDEHAKEKASKTWRTLRLASRSKLNLLEKIEDGKNLNILFEPPPALEEPAKPDATAENGVNATDSSPKQDAGKENAVTPDQPAEQG